LNYSVYDLKQQKAGETVEVELSAAANVLLLDSSNYSSFRAGRQHRYHGGLAKQSPIHLQIPRSGHWYLVIHMAGLRGSVRHSMRILPSALPELRQPNLRSIIEDVAVPEPESPLPPGAEEYDVFISHATEDKDGIVRDLVNALGERDVNVWYDEFQLRIGDSLRQKIDAGLARSRFGLVVVSHAFFAKNWPQYELDGLVSLEMAGRQRILPVWHEITKDEVLGYSPSLADKVALSTGTYTVEEIAQEIAEVVAEPGVDAQAA
jgi:uncharacterized protein YxjI